MRTQNVDQLRTQNQDHLRTHSGMAWVGMGWGGVPLCAGGWGEDGVRGWGGWGWGWGRASKVGKRTSWDGDVGAMGWGSVPQQEQET